MYFKILILTFILIVNLNAMFSQDKTITYFYDPNTKPVELIIDISHLNAHVSFEPNENKVTAKAEYIFRTKRIKTDSIVFFAPDFHFQNIKLDGSVMEYRQTNKNVIIYPDIKLDLNKNYSVIFEYDVSPEDGNPYFVGWDDPKGKLRKQVWAHRPQGWLPFIDDRLTVDMYITFDKKFLVYSNGVRVDVETNEDGTKTWHYRMNKNHPFFSTALVIGDYQYKTIKTKSGIPVELWYYPEYENKFETTYQYMSEMLDFFEKEMAYPYPWELYRQAPVANYLFGAMETTTSTIYGDYMLIDEGAYWQRNYINVNAHELAHQWFGNYISHLTPRDVWLTESFATFYAKMFEKSVFGEDYYQNDKLQEIDKTFQQAKKNSNPIASSRAGTFRIYQKGSLVLDMLKYVLGDEYFRLSVKRYLEEHQYEYAESNDFLRAVYRTTGMNLDWFFEQWLYRGGEPYYKVSYYVYNDDNGKRFTNISVEQIHKRSELVQTFRMPVDFIVYYRDGSSDSIRAWVEDEYTNIIIPNTGRKNIDFVLFDPGNRILKKVEFKKDFSELAAQALKAPNMIDRYDALMQLRDINIKKKLSVLTKCYQQEKFHLTKSEIIYQLAVGYGFYDRISKESPIISDDTALLIFKSAISDNDALVRKAVLVNIKNIPVQLKKEYMTLLRDESYANVELALTNLAEEFPGDIELFLDITENMEGWRGKNIRMKWLEIAVLNGEKEYIAELKDYAAVSYEFETRINAIRTLRRLNFLDKDHIKSLFAAVRHWNFKLSNAAKNAIEYYSKQAKYSEMINNSLKYEEY